jgi:hypothetical protein
MGGLRKGAAGNHWRRRGRRHRNGNGHITATHGHRTLNLADNMDTRSGHRKFKIEIKKIENFKIHYRGEKKGELDAHTHNLYPVYQGSIFELFLKICLLLLALRGSIDSFQKLGLENTGLMTSSNCRNKRSIVVFIINNI